MCSQGQRPLGLGAGGGLVLQPRPRYPVLMEVPFGLSGGPMITIEILRIFEFIEEKSANKNFLMVHFS